MLRLAPPAAPVIKLQDIVPSTHSVAYSWILGADGHSPVTHVSISCRTLSSGILRDAMTRNTVPPSGLVGLSPGESYRCNIYAHNAVGRSPASLPFTVTTLSAGQNVCMLLLQYVIMGFL